MRKDKKRSEPRSWGARISILTHALRSRSSRPLSAMRTPKNTKDDIILLREVGRGACGVVNEDLYLPSMTMVAVKSVGVGEGDKR